MGAALSIVPDETTPDELSSLADVANDFHARSVEAGRSRIDFAIESGKALIAAKSACKHGDWLPWLTKHFDGSQSTAKNYMALVRNRQRVGDLLDENPDLSIREAVKALAEPKPNDETGDNVSQQKCDGCKANVDKSELTDSEDGQFKYCDGCLDDEPREPNLRPVISTVRKLHELINSLASVNHREFDEHEMMMAQTELDLVIASIQNIKGIYDGTRD